MENKKNNVVSYGYYSKLLKKPFDSVDELKAAEEEYNKAHAHELQVKEEKKSLADEVSKAYRNLLEVSKKAKRDVLEASKKADREVSLAEDAYHAKLNEFIKKYGSYHATYTNVDGKESFTISDILDDFFNYDPFRLLK